jgi:ABC-type glycerol-3-phosphate transport system substrate-binding protein
MNKSIVYVFVLFAAVIIVACSGNKAAETSATSDEWPEMDEFHMIMAESFHPYKDSANLEPAKAHAAEMASVAEKWANAPLPEKVNTDEIKADLNQLKADTKTFIQTAQSGDSTQIGQSLTSLHDLFHKLQESWYGGKKEGEGHEHKH